MAVPSSGQLRLRGDISLEVYGNATGTNISLGTMSDIAGFVSPDTMSEFYGWSNAVAPSATTNSITSITETSMTLSGNITSDGGATITQRGFYFGNNSASPTNNTKYTVGGTTGSYSLNRTGLSAGTTYYCWAFATNSAGTTFGARTQANTIAAYVPVWSLGANSSICSGTATNCDYGGDAVSVEAYLYYRNPNTASYVQYASYYGATTGGNSETFNPSTQMTNGAGRSNQEYARGTKNLFTGKINSPTIGLAPEAQFYYRIYSPTVVSNVTTSNNVGNTSNNWANNNNVTGYWYVSPSTSCPGNITGNVFWDVT
tara:strand:+ start:5632 stop:6576 length:945 start_codon:yes stop_codon:yes gene_type:complete